MPGVKPADCQMLGAGPTGRILNVLFVGQRRDGTSGVINALLGARVLAFNGAELKAAVTEIRFGTKPAARVEVSGGASHDIAFMVIGDSRRPIALRGMGHVRRIVVDSPSNWLAGGIRLIEAPPVGSLYEYNRHIAQQLAACVDVIVFVCSVARPLRRTETEFLEGLRRYGKKTFCVIDNLHALQPDRPRSTLPRTKRQIARAMGGTAPIFAVSAELALASKLDCSIGLPTDPGFTAFEQGIRTLLAERKKEGSLDTIAEVLLRILSHAGASLGLELAALTASPAEVARLTVVLRRAIDALEVARCRAQASFNIDTAALLVDEIEPALTRFEDKQRRCTRSMSARQGLSNGGSPAATRSFDHPAIRAAFAGWYLREERAVSRVFDALCERFWMEVQGAIEALLCRVRECCPNAASRVDEGTAAKSKLLSRSEPRRGFWQKPSMLRLRWILCHPAYPRVISRDACSDDSSAAARLDAHACRIRYDFEWRIRRSTAAACQDAERRAHATVASMREALQRAAAVRSGRPPRTAARCNELNRVLTAIASLRTRVQTLLRPNG